MPVEILKDSLKNVVVQVGRHIGFERASVEAVDILVEVLHRYLTVLSGHIAQCAENAGDNYYSVLDGVSALELMRQPLSSLLLFADQAAYLMPRPVRSMVVPLYGRNKLTLPARHQLKLMTTADQMQFRGKPRMNC